MTQTSTAAQNLTKLTERQSALLIKVLCALLANDGELSGYALEVDYKAGTPKQLGALVDKGVLVTRRGKMIMPKGPYKGEWMEVTFYSAA